MVRLFASTNRHCLRAGRFSYAIKLPFVRPHLSSLVSTVSAPFLELNISTFFRDMFTLPTTGTAIEEPINLEETADVLGRLLNGIFSSQFDPSILPAKGLGQLHALAKAHDKFGIETHQFEAKAAFNSALKDDPWAGLAHASHINDLELGRNAIQLMRLDKTYDSDIWELLSDVKPTWQIALARLVLPKMKNESCDYYDGDEEDRLTDVEWYGMSSTKFRISMKEVAKRFNPK